MLLAKANKMIALHLFSACPAIVLRFHIEHMVPGKKKKNEDISLLNEKLLEGRRRLSLKT